MRAATFLGTVLLLTGCGGGGGGTDPAPSSFDSAPNTSVASTAAPNQGASGTNTTETSPVADATSSAAARSLTASVDQAVPEADDPDGPGDGLHGLVDATGLNPSALALGHNHTCMLSSGRVTCWGDNSWGQSDVPSTLSKVTALAAADQNTCALDEFYVTCWGIDGFDIFPAFHGTQLDTGGFHVCVIDEDGLSCFRSANDYGELEVPADLVNPSQVATGLKHSCALDEKGVQCWGDNAFGQSTVPELNAPSTITAGGHHTCALDDSGVVCWGNNQLGQLDVPSLVEPSSVVAGYNYTCAIDRFGLLCWGDNRQSQSDVPSLVEPTAVYPGTHHTCAVEENRDLRCWGYNAQGQLDIPGGTSSDTRS